MKYILILLLLFFSSAAIATQEAQVNNDYRLLFSDGYRYINSSSFPSEPANKTLSYWSLSFFWDDKVSEKMRFAEGISIMAAQDPSNSAYQKWGLGFSRGYYLFLTVFHIRGTAWLFHNQTYNSLATELDVSLPAILLGGNYFAGINGGLGYEVAHIGDWRSNFYYKLGITFGLGTALFR